MLFRSSPGFNGDFDYGYQLWVDSKRGEIVFNGMLGQNVWICPKNGIVSVVMSGSNELFQETSTQHVIRRYLGGEMNDELDRRDLGLLHEKETHFCDAKMRVRPKQYRRGFLVRLGLRSPRVFDDSWTPMLGNYALSGNNVSILPLVVAAMQNNFAAGIERFSLAREGDGLYMLIYEGGVSYKLEVGIYEYKTVELDVRGEKYIVRVLGECVKRADGVDEYRIEVIFPELPNTRSLTIVKSTEGSILITFSEMPNNKIVESILGRMSEVSSPIAFGVELIERRFGDGVVFKTLEKTFNPTIVGADMSREDYPDIIKEVERRHYEESSRARLLRAFVDRFFKEAADEAVEGDGMPVGDNLITKVIGHIARRKNAIRKNKK